MEDNKVIENTEVNNAPVIEEKSCNSKEKSKEEKNKLKKSDKIFFIITSALILILATYLILFSTVFFHVSVSGRSMENTLNGGDILVVNKQKTPELGDVIIVSGMKENGDWLVKRVIGVEGDIISIKGGKVYRNGELLEEEYVNGFTYAPNCLDPADVSEVIYEVNENEIFFLGDNREDSLDSRYYGNCKIENVEGVVPEFSMKIKGITTPVNRFFINFKKFLGLKTNLREG